MSAKTITYTIILLIFLFSGLVYHEIASADEELPVGKFIPGIAVSIGTDVNHIPDSGDDGDAIFIEFIGHFYKKPWGFNAYLGRTIDPDVWVIGAEPTYRWKQMTFGLGLAMLDETTYANGTKRNFYLTGCGEIISSLDVCWRHWSHGGWLGFEKEKTNRGWNILMVRFKNADPSRWGRGTPKIFSQNRWYVGAGIGQSTGSLGFNKHIQEEIIENGYQEEIAILESLGAPLRLSSGFNNKGFKIFAGYRFGKKKRWAFEVAYADLGTYKASVETDLYLNASGEGIVEGMPIEGEATIAGHAGINASARIRALSVSFVHTFSISKRVLIFPRIGLAHLVGKIVTSENISYSYDVDAMVDGVFPVNETGGETSVDINKSVFRAKLLPLIGAGIDIAATKNYSIRVEYERYGHPTKDPSISAWTMTGMRRW